MRHFAILIAVAPLLLLLSPSAEALRCGNKLVTDGMHEVEVREACGEPVSTEHLGFVIRHYGHIGGRRGLHHRHLFSREVAVKELIYNFGPHRLMRKLRFEGGVLTSIRTLGYGYRE